MIENWKSLGRKVFEDIKFQTFILYSKRSKSKWKLHSHVWLCNSMDYTARGILQIRILEWIAFPFSSRFSWSRNQTRVSHIAGGFFTNWAIRENQKIKTLLHFFPHYFWLLQFILYLIFVKKICLPKKKTAKVTLLKYHFTITSDCMELKSLVSRNYKQRLGNECVIE